MSSLNDAYLCCAKRTPIGSFQGTLAGESATALGAHVISAVVNQENIAGEAIDEVILGCVLSAGVGQAPARQAALRAGLPTSVQAMTINKVCGAGLKAVMLAANGIQLGQANAIVAGGMESMSQAPYLLPTMRAGARLGDAPALDSILVDGLWDVYNDQHMGSCAELCARENNLSREDQDAFAIESYTRAKKAITEGYFQEEIVPISVSRGKITQEVAEDEEPGRGKLEKIPMLKPVFEKEGTVTAANASSLNDGAAAMLVCSEDFMKRHSLSPLARVVSQNWYAQAPEWFTTAPVGAVGRLLDKAGLEVSDIDLFEINEAFSAVAIACREQLGIHSKKLNINGGAVALGHPLGASGARILTTLLYSLKRLKLKRGVAAICNGGGEATAVLVERV